MLFQLSFEFESPETNKSLLACNPDLPLHAHKPKHVALRGATARRYLWGENQHPWRLPGAHCSARWITYPLVMTNSSPWYRWPIEIDDFLSYKSPFMLGIFHGYGSHNQMVRWLAATTAPLVDKILQYRIFFCSLAGLAPCPSPPWDAFGNGRTSNLSGWWF